MASALALRQPEVLPPQTVSGVPDAHPMGGAMVVYVLNPMAPQIGLRRFGRCEGLTVNQVVERAGWRLAGSHVCMRNGELVHPDMLDVALIGKADLVVLIRLPEGAKGGASQILGMVAMIALALTAPYLAGLALGGTLAAGTGAYAIAFAGITWGSLATVGIVLAGSMIISALLPKPKALTNNNTDATSNPVYSLSAQSNTARLLQKIPERFGTLKFKPDLAAQASFDFINSEQELNEEFCLGMGEFEIHEIGISNNPIWVDGAYTGSYPEIVLQFMPPGTPNTLFTDNVVTSVDVSSIELLGTNQDGYDWSGPFVLNPSDTLCHRIEVDFSAPAGLFSVDNSGNLKAAGASFTVQVQLIDDIGIPVPGHDWQTVITEALSQSNRSQIRQSYGADLTPGRYRVRFERTNEKATDLNTQDQIAILAMRGFLPNAPARYDVTCIALKARSTKNLNGTSAQQFYVMATRKLPIWNPETRVWSAPTATRSIAAAAAYLCRAQNGLRRTDNKVDLDKLWALDAIWAARNNYFDGTFDDGGSAWTNLQAILRVGRAEPLRVGRYITFNRDEPKIIPRAAFSPANMLPGTFNIDYLTWDENAKDGVWIDYIDSRNWEPNSVYCALPDSTTDPNDAPHISIVGITVRQHAWEEGMFIAACNRWRRKFPNFRTEMEGRVCFRGDKIAIAHWLPVWGGSGAMVDLGEDDAGDIVTLSEPWDHQQQLDDGPKLFRCATPDGQVYGPVTCDLLDDGKITGQAVIRMTQTAIVSRGKYAGQHPRDWPVWEGGGLGYERPHCAWGTGTLQPTDALMVAMKPESGMNVTMAAVIDDMRVHYADGTIPPLDPDDVTPAPPDETNPPIAPSPDDLVITGVTVREISQSGGVTVPTVLAFTVEGAPRAASFDARWKWSDAADYQPIRTGFARTFQFAAVTASLTLQVRAEGQSGFGPWFDVSYEAAGVPSNPINGSNDIVVTTVYSWVADTTDGSWTWAAIDGALSYLVVTQLTPHGGGVWQNRGSTSVTSTAFTVSQDAFAFLDERPDAVRIGVKPVFANGSPIEFIFST